MQFVSIVWPILLLLLACLGLGEAILFPFRRYLPPLPIWLDASIAYFVGQGILGSAFIFLGLTGLFTQGILLLILIPSSVAALWFLRITASDWSVCIRGVFCAWRKAPLVWRTLSALLVLLLCYGFTTIGGWIQGDASSFYLAIAKVTAAYHQLAPLPGYESFSAVGLLAEMLLAALFSLGMPNISPRIFSWANFIPALFVLYGLARQCRLSRRGGVLTIVMASTSSAVVLLWGSGKTDLFALGPAFGACFFASLAWDSRHHVSAVFVTGFLAGLACEFKLSYLVPLLLGVTMILMWQACFDAYALVRLRDWDELHNIFRRAFKDILIVVAGFLSAFAPHVIKNVTLLHRALDIGSHGPLFSSATTLWLVLSYPFALTFGRYWAQFGTLSPLILAFAPLILALARPATWRNSRLAALGFASIGGVLLWIALMPSFFMPRYFLATLLMCAIPAAAAADAIGRRPGLLARSIPAVAVVTLIATPFHANNRFYTFDLNRTLNYPTGANEDCVLSSPSNSYCAAHKTINDAAAPDDRVLLLTYCRYWLRPDLLRKASTEEELENVREESGDFWSHVYQKDFRFILWDENIIQMDKKIFESPPAGTSVRQLFREGALVAYQVMHQKTQASAGPLHNPLDQVKTSCAE